METEATKYTTDLTVSLHFYGQDLDPDSVTETLGLKPVVARRRGEERSSGGKTVVQKTGVWGYRIRRAAENAAPLVDQLIAELGTRKKILTSLPTADEGIIEIFYSMITDQGDLTCVTDLSSVQLSALAEYGLPLRFTVYGTPPD